MSSMTPNGRILVVDDAPSIHEDFKKIFTQKSGPSAELRRARAALFDSEQEPPPACDYELEFALQGRQGAEAASAALAAGRPFALAFVDMRMPPGWDGVETIEALWRIDARLEVVICTAVSDRSWEEVTARLGATDRLLILKKPFDPMEVLQCASTLSTKWQLARQAALRVAELEDLAARRTSELTELNTALHERIDALKHAEQSARDDALRIERANSELREAGAAARAAARSKSEFLANMSHEIRTPMTAILGFADLLNDPSMRPEERKSCIQTIRRNGDHLLAILNDILDLSKIEAGRMAIERVPFAPVQLLAEVVSLMRVRAREKDLKLEVRFDSDVPAIIESDPTRLRQVLFNLIGNAIKFTHQGGVEVRVRLEGARDHPELCFEVADTGIGIAPDKFEMLFEPFSQVDTSSTRPFGGTGLGLTISRRLARLLGGDIRVHSRVGAGSSFIATVATGRLDGITMLARESEAESIRATAHEDDELELVRISGRILLAEDGRDNQRLISAILRRAGAEIELADNGRVACELVLCALAERKSYDLILMDMQMPELDGYDAARFLRAQGYVGPIVALTAHAMSGDREKCLAAGCDDYATKPVDRAHLLATCARHLERRLPPPALPRTQITRLGEGSPVLRHPEEPLGRNPGES